MVQTAALKVYLSEGKPYLRKLWETACKLEGDLKVQLRIRVVLRSLWETGPSVFKQIKISGFFRSRSELVDEILRGNQVAMNVSKDIL